MEYKKISRNSDDIDELKKLYVDSFPKEERMAWDSLFQLATQEDVDFLAYYMDGKLVAATYTVNSKKISWLFYFAVVPEYRGRKIGTKILSSLLNSYDDRRLMIDIEDPEQPAENTQQRIRRFGFYKRMGFKDYGIRQTVKGIQYNIMAYGGRITIDDYKNLTVRFRNSLLQSA
ncbi:MAG: GNAT family N-acetyltransferase [Prevotella sp.]